MSTAIENINELADEYVLGLLDAADHALVDERIEHEPELRAAVAASRDRFLALDLLSAAGAGPDGLWDRIASGLDETRAPASGGPAKVAANDNRETVWRLAALAGMAASLLLAIGLGFSLLLRPEPQVIAVLVNDAGEPLVLVEDFGDASARITPLVAFDVPENQVMQVWTLPSKEMGPVSLGLLPRSETITLDGPDLPQPQEAQLYEITIEQAGGSPTGRPTGPILVKGFAKQPR
ncbi:anti-sigma factor [Pararhizobium antarcticum]|uniref:Anti-sigma factor n=1 Tax=Pararhizobium antarcticum TaxID=1798805 RepID=A0A657LRJ0_9HYPH|nr:anti-sigma factor [Pararhizobium antarcticum]OJF95040.1 anti-sigma factor [Pararhizobium antarcticum]OJF98139.1 anti-sigma factor [Rhizobium sp. 58]